jgi:peptidoglycan hydrolase CwlO-like protein
MRDSAQLEDLRREQADAEGQLARLTMKVNEFEGQRAETTDAIERSKAVCEEIKFFTKAEVHRLKGVFFAGYDSDRLAALLTPE